MKSRPAILLFLLSVAIPVALLAWLGRGMAREESRHVTDRFLALLESRVDEAEQKTAIVLQKTAEQLDEVLTRTATEPEALDGLVNGVPLIKRGFLVDADGHLAFPDPTAPRHAADEGFLRRTQVIWENNVRFGQAEAGTTVENAPPSPQNQMVAAENKNAYAEFAAKDARKEEAPRAQPQPANQPQPQQQAALAGLPREEAQVAEQAWNYPAGKSYVNSRARPAEVAQSRNSKAELGQELVMDSAGRSKQANQKSDFLKAAPKKKALDFDDDKAKRDEQFAVVDAPAPVLAPAAPSASLPPPPPAGDPSPKLEGAAGAVALTPSPLPATATASAPEAASVARKSAGEGRSKEGLRARAGTLGLTDTVDAVAPPPVRSVNSGWHLWFYGDGVHFIYWQRRSDGRVIGAEIERSKLLDEIIRALPSGAGESASTSELTGEPTLPTGKIRLTGARGEKLHEWGGYVIPAHARPLLTRTLGAPLEMWRWQYFADPAAIPTVGKGALWAGWTAVGGLILLLAGYAYFEMTRALREARQRVSFVNQVSHELKTPLTNIRLYAEMASEVLTDEEDHAARDYLAVVKEETERLSRLIHHVLTFSRQERGQTQVRPCSQLVRPLLLAALERWRPAFNAKSFVVEQDFRLQAEVMADADSVTQILDNLLSNVEKYASHGAYLCLRAWEEPGRALIEVEDRGPGVPGSARNRIFQPFVRLNESLTEGTAGTGIGLTISRQLAEAQGGHLTVRHAEPRGAIFQLSLPLCKKPA